ncbi:MAG: von Willebrand factor type A domain-containing protein [Myxococcota bacterium]
MSTEQDGWRLTAYALGELSEEEREAVARWIAGDPAARAEVEAIQATAAGLRDALSDEVVPGLLPIQRAAVLRGVGADGSSVAGGQAAAGGDRAGEGRGDAVAAVAANEVPRGGRGPGVWVVGAALAMAAGLLLAVGLGRLSGGEREPTIDEVAQVPPRPAPERQANQGVEAPPVDGDGTVGTADGAPEPAPPMDEATRRARAAADGYREAPPYGSAKADDPGEGGSAALLDSISGAERGAAPEPVARAASQPSGGRPPADGAVSEATARPAKPAVLGERALPPVAPEQLKRKEAFAAYKRGPADKKDSATTPPAAAVLAEADAPDLAAASTARPRGRESAAPASSTRPPSKNRARPTDRAGDGDEAGLSSEPLVAGRRPIPDRAKAEAPRGGDLDDSGPAFGALGGTTGTGMGGGGKAGRGRDYLAAGGPKVAPSPARWVAERRARVQAQQARPFPAEEIEAPEAEAPVESYDVIAEHPFRETSREPLSTFSADVDTASFTNVRRFLDRGELPPRDAVRIEEIVNWFPYDDPAPRGGGPFALRAEVAPCPWDGRHQLVRIALKAREVTPAQRPAANLVFLVDVSGSMQRPEKLPLLKQALTMLTQELDGADRVAIVAYSGGAGVVLHPTSGADKATILATLSKLRAGGSTNGSAGIALAYETARRYLIAGGTNRVILATDGDFNVGTTGRRALEAQIAQEAATGVYLTVLGFGTGNLQDGRLEALSNRGNGQYAYIDSAQEAWRVLVQQMESTLVAVAKDVKIQVEFDPARVAAWRLVGYESRAMANWEFQDDRRDAGDMGAGHAVNALYELVPRRPRVTLGSDLKYAPSELADDADAPAELLTVSVRYKAPDGHISQRLDLPVLDYGLRLSQVSGDFRFAAAAATFGMLLRRSPYAAGATFGLVDELGRDDAATDGEGRRRELLRLAAIARGLMGR